MTALEANVRGIEKDGLLWGRSQFVEIGYGIKKLQINAVVEDEKVFVVDLQAEIEEDEDHVQSTDVVRFDVLCSFDLNRSIDNRNRRLCRNFNPTTNIRGS
jgi:translation elongation factor EF-1beta